jgi:hypothetical protein
LENKRFAAEPTNLARPEVQLLVSEVVSSEAGLPRPHFPRDGSLTTRLATKEGELKMRHTHIRLGLLTLLLVLALAGAAFAGDTTVTMDFQSVGGENGGGFYTYPYYFSINDGASTPLICDNFDNEITAPETWTANVYSLLSAGSPGNGYYSALPNAQAMYDAAGLIFEAILTNQIGSVQGNWAIWGLFSTNARNSSFFASSGANNVTAEYLSMAEGDMADDDLPAYLDNMVVYTPAGGVAGVNGPQEFIGIAPEPASLFLFGSGLALLGGVIRKRRRN